MRPSLKNLERGDIHSCEGKRPKNGRMEQQKAVEYGSRKASSVIVNPRNIYIYMFYSSPTRCTIFLIFFLTTEVSKCPKPVPAPME
jgi:hypothetical protein